MSKTMRGEDISQPKLFVKTTVTDFVPKHHPLRSLRKLLDAALEELDLHFDEMYSDLWRESVAPGDWFVRQCCRRSLRFSERQLE